MPGRIRLAAPLVIVALALAACSGSSATPSPASPTSVASEAPSTAASEAPSTAASEAPSTAPSSAPSTAASTCEAAQGPGTAAEIKDFTFPSGLSVKVGDSISWTDGDSAPHTVTFDNGTCDSGRISPGSTVTVTYTVAGTYTFHCAIHSSMTGTLEVTP